MCLSGTTQIARVKDNEGKVLTTERVRTDRLAHHLIGVLNRPEPDHPTNPTDGESVININFSNDNEVQIVNSFIKYSKSPDIDSSTY